MLSRILRADTKCACLTLRKNPLGDSGAAELAGAIRSSRSLVHVDLASTGIRSKGAAEIFAALESNECVVSLDLSSCEGLFRNRIGREGSERFGAVLRANRVLSIVDLSGTAMKSEGLESVAKGIERNHTLISLKIANNEIVGGSRSLACLKKIALKSKLQEFDVSRNPLGNECFKEFSRILPESTIVKLICNSIGIDCNVVVIL